MITAPEFAGVTEMVRGSSFPVSFFQLIGSINAVIQDEMNFFTVLDDTHSMKEEGVPPPISTQNCFFIIPKSSKEAPNIHL